MKKNTKKEKYKRKSKIEFGSTAGSK